MWLRAPDELVGRPFWIIGLASLAVAAALLGNPIGAVSWGTALVLTGGALFLASVQQIWISRALLIGAFSLSALPLSLTASGWQGNALSFWYILPFLLIAQALLMTGLIRSALRPSTRASLEVTTDLGTKHLSNRNWTFAFRPDFIRRMGLGWSLKNRRMGSGSFRFFADLRFAVGYPAFPSTKSCARSLGTSILYAAARPPLSKSVESLSLARASQPNRFRYPRRR